MHQNYIKYNAKTASKSTQDYYPLLHYHYVSTTLAAQIPSGNAIANSQGLLHAETSFSYFGARYYDSDILTGWLSVDPMADKYPSLSPYAYCAWNPIKLMDPDGEEIWILTNIYTNERVRCLPENYIMRIIPNIVATMTLHYKQQPH